MRRNLKLDEMLEILAKSECQADSVVNYAFCLREAEKEKLGYEVYLQIAKTYLENQVKVVRNTGKICADFGLRKDILNIKNRSKQYEICTFAN